jgi:hypothetical protein
MIHAFYCFADIETVPLLINEHEFTQQFIDDILTPIIDSYYPPSDILAPIRIQLDPNDFSNYIITPALERI